MSVQKRVTALCLHAFAVKAMRLLPIKIDYLPEASIKPMGAYSSENIRNVV